jgi:hypothetical protein
VFASLKRGKDIQAKDYLIDTFRNGGPVTAYCVDHVSYPDEFRGSDLPLACWVLRVREGTPWKPIRLHPDMFYLVGNGPMSMP